MFIALIDASPPPDQVLNSAQRSSLIIYRGDRFAMFAWTYVVG